MVDTAVAIKNLKGSPSFVRVLTLCGSVALLDGYDTQAMAYAAPILSEQWSIGRPALGPVFSAVLFGLMIGAAAFGPVADRLGRKPVICVATLTFGACSLATALAADVTQLIVWRFLTGLGLGAALPNIIALTSEHAPANKRTLAVSVMFCGFPAGSIIGGLTAPSIIVAFGWEGIFIIGGVTPLLLLPLLLKFLVESPKENNAEVRDDSPNKTKPGGFFELYSRRLRRDTLLLWTTFFASLLVMYFLVNWLPTLFRDAGLSLSDAIRATVILNIGGVIGAVLLARLADTFGPLRILPPAYFVAGIAIAAIGFIAPASWLMSVAVFLAGTGIVGGQIACNALAAQRYPTPLRALGIGWALGFGRLGSVIGPLVGGALLAAGVALGSMFLIIAAIAMIAGLALLFMKRTAH